MAHSHDDDDLDALLDDCINTMDEQERRHEDEVRARDAAREAELEKHRAESDFGTEMMRLIQSLVNGESGDAGTDPDSLMNQLQGEVTRVSSLIDELPDVSEEERANIAHVRKMFDRLTTMSSTTEDDAAGGDDMGNEALVEALKKCMEEIGKTTGDDTGNTAASVSAGTAPSLEATTGIANAADVEGAVTAGLSDILLECLLDPGMLGVMKLMQKAYPRWLAVNEGDTSAEDLERYNKQFKIVNSICDLVGDAPVAREDVTKTNELISLTHELTSLGALPPGLEKLVSEEPPRE
ncbi:peroxin 19 [Trypanosoma rangeli]|uniref:Peroxin 19 n=1 Tax=Trypanosoma rangeli TaxID=5698 RepID=A0A422MWS6_TRYRA|nr:peroxin 19 [Trypanosoma rangeli]RNE97704.1 peroxin 19 [Trypanosoma rangeli]|eukprot:RNE97704.1 peroxin 19 [Trypanosoma rangeli]